MSAPWPADLAVVTTFFNPCGYRSKQENFPRFEAPLRAMGAQLLVMEAAFDDLPFSLPEGPGVHRVRGRDVMWHKERLLDAAVKRLPPHITKVAWIDADVLFERPDWAQATSAALEHHVVVQPFSEAIRLPRGALAFDGNGERFDSFGLALANDPHVLMAGEFSRHGHTGFAWAARRELWSAGPGLYDACIAGSGDHMMAHAFCGDWESKCIRRILGDNAAHLRWFRQWARKAYALTRARVGHIEGRLLHLWHGEMAQRRYVQRNEELAAFGFDPPRDLEPDGEGLWRFTGHNPALRDWARRYFHQRREDEAPAP